jgi:antirestriction protein ArdC
MKKKVSVAEVITSRIIEKLEAGCIPWLDILPAVDRWGFQRDSG